MSVSRIELLLWLAANDDGRNDAFADLVAAGLLTVHSDADEIVGLSASAEWRSMLRVLPTATA
jgi:hypothetical protein